MPSARAQLGELVAEGLEAAAPLFGQLLDLVEVVEGFGEQDRELIAEVFVLLPDLVPARPGVASLRPGSQPRHVAGPDPVAGTEQDPCEGHARLRVGGDPRVGEHLDDLGHLEESREPHDLHRHAPLDHRELQAREQP